MKFQKEKISDFKALFEDRKEKIESQEGCHSVALLLDLSDPTKMFTYSIWDNENCLNAYRHSDFFKATWIQTKAMFDGKPEAWSLETLAE